MFVKTQHRFRRHHITCVIKPSTLQVFDGISMLVLDPSQPFVCAKQAFFLLYASALCCKRQPTSFNHFRNSMHSISTSYMALLIVLSEITKRNAGSVVVCSATAPTAGKFIINLGPDNATSATRIPTSQFFPGRRRTS